MGGGRGLDVFQNIKSVSNVLGGFLVVGKSAQKRGMPYYKPIKQHQGHVVCSCLLCPALCYQPFHTWNVESICVTSAGSKRGHSPAG